MLALLPLLCLFSIFAAVLSTNKCEWRDAFLRSVVFWCIYLIVISESLSLFRAITYTGLAVAWTVPTVMLAFLIYRNSAMRNYLLGRFRSFKLPEGRENQIAFASISGILLCLLFIAIDISPNNNDALQYHLSRVMHWQANHSLNVYPCNDFRQQAFSPLSELLVLQFQILSGGFDFLANAVQWFFFVASAIGVSATVARLGGGVRGQWLAAIFCITAPTLVLQSTTAENDLGCAFFVLALAFFGIPLWKNFRFESIFYTAASCGLAVAAKGTAYFLILAPLCFCFAELARRSTFQKALRLPICCLALVLFLNAGVYYRNIQLFGTIIAPPVASAAVKNVHPSPGKIFSNLLRNIGSEFNGCPQGWRVELLILRLHSLLGLDPSDPDTTFEGLHFFISHPEFNEYYEGSPLHLLLCVLATIVAIRKARNDSGFRRALVYFTYAILGLLALSSAIKWQIWISRFHCPLIVLCACGVGLVGERYCRFSFASASILTIGAIPYLLFNINKPIVGSTSHPSALGQSAIACYFLKEPNLLLPYKETVDLASKNHWNEIGFAAKWQYCWEYPLWQLAFYNGSPLKVRHVLVDNLDAKTLQPEYDAHLNAIFAIALPEDWTPKVTGLVGFEEVRRWEKAIRQSGPSYLGNVRLFTRKTRM